PVAADDARSQGDPAVAQQARGRRRRVARAVGRDRHVGEGRGRAPRDAATEATAAGEARGKDGTGRAPDAARTYGGPGARAVPDAGGDRQRVSAAEEGHDAPDAPVAPYTPGRGAGLVRVSAGRERPGAVAPYATETGE